MEKWTIDMSLKAKEGNGLTSKYASIQKNLGTYELFVFNKIKENPNHIIINAPFNRVPLYVYLGWNIDLETVQNLDKNVLNFITPKQLYDWSIYCKEQGTLRDLVEMLSCSEQQFADLLYQLDFTNKTQDEIPKDLKIYQNSWQSYGRKYIQDLNKEIQKKEDYKENLLLLPCSKRRPYYKNGLKSAFKKHEKLADFFSDNTYHKVVMTNIGLLPEEFWTRDLVMNYTAGVPDIWRIQKISENFFKNKKFNHIACFVEFPPYLEILEIQKMRYNLNIDFFVPKKYKALGAKFAIDKVK